MREFPGLPVVRTLLFHHGGPGFNPWLGKKVNKKIKYR